MSTWYKLVNKNTVECDMLEAAQLLESERRIVAFDEIGEVKVSTVFLGSLYLLVNQVDQ